MNITNRALFLKAIANAGPGAPMEDDQRKAMLARMGSGDGGRSYAGGGDRTIQNKSLMTDQQRKAMFAKGGPSNGPRPTNASGDPSNGPQPPASSPNAPKPAAAAASNGPGPLKLKPTPTKASVNAGATNKLPAQLPKGMNPYTAALAAAKEIALGNPTASKEAALTTPQPRPLIGSDPITWSPGSNQNAVGGWKDPGSIEHATGRLPPTKPSTKYNQPQWAQPQPTIRGLVDPGLPTLPKKKKV